MIVGYIKENNQEMADKIKESYKTSINIYDSILTQNSILGKLYMKLFWSGTDDNVIAGKVLSYIPDDFTGTLLDVPVGTAVFTYDKWRSLSKAKITCLDYSEDMLSQARGRIGVLENVSCIQGDVGNLPMEAASFDMVLSMNGFHAFPDKRKAYQEIHRVLKEKGVFMACFYVKGQSKVTDWLVKSILAKKGWFTPPFETVEEVEGVLKSLYNQVELNRDGSMVYFKCVK